MSIKLSAAQQAAFDGAAAMKPLMTEVGGTLWGLAEVGLCEYRSAAYLAELYRSHGFAVRTGIAGFPTGFVAEYGSGSPVIALLCEYDALPAMSTVDSGANGHGCGHNLFGAAATGCALMLRDIIEKHGIGGTLRVYGTPGEENYASKAYYVHHGLFDDVDCSVGFHAHDENKVNYTVSAGTLIKNYIFHGKPAHAGNYPWLGCSALDAVEIMNVACNYLREHLRPDTRIQYIITKGGDAPNIVPELASSQYVVRAADVPYMDEVAAKVDNCAHAAALATGCSVEIEYVDKTYNTVLLREYAELAQGYLELAGAPQFTPDELETACSYGNGSGLHTQVTPLPAVEDYQGGATDEGDVSWVVPHVSIYVSNVARETTLHTLPSTCQMNLPAAYTAMVTQVKATATMLVGLLAQPDKVASLRAAHTAKLGGHSYAKDPSYTLGAKFNPNCEGITVKGNNITADLDGIILLPQGSAGKLTVTKTDGTAVAELVGSGTVGSAVTLTAGDSLMIYYTVDGGEPYLIGYYNV